MTVWTLDNIKTASTMWKNGLSAAKIAAAMGGMSRNAVIGAAHRNPDHFPPRRTRVAIRPVRVHRPIPSPAPPPKKPASSPMASAAPAPIEPVEKIVIETGPMIGTAFANLNRRQCRWPINDDRPGPLMACCGRAVGFDVSYCGEHKRRATI